MVRRRWPDVVVVLGVAALAVLGAVALWGDELGRAWRAPTAPSAPTHGGGVT